MSSLNRVLFIGNLTRDPELRSTNSGTSVCQFGLAINRESKDASGQKREEVTFLDVEAWGKVAEIIAKYCSKGRQLLIEGRLRQDRWEDKQSGAKRSRIVVVCESFQFLGSHGDADSAANPGNSDRGQGQDTRRPATRPQNAADLDEEPPF